MFNPNLSKLKSVTSISTSSRLSIVSSSKKPVLLNAVSDHTKESATGFKLYVVK